MSKNIHITGRIYNTIKMCESTECKLYSVNSD